MIQSDLVILQDQFRPDEFGTADCDCDCAIILPVRPAPTIQRLFSQSEPYQMQSGLIVVEPRTGFYGVANPGQTPGICVLNKTALDLLKRFEQPRTVFSIIDPDEVRCIVQLVKAGLLVEKSRTDMLPQFGNEDTLVGWLHITDDCPLRCKYCYIPKSPARMSLATGEKAVTTIFEEAVKHAFSKVKIKYAGGEPTLQLDLVARLHQSALVQAARHRLVLDEVILTSGVMSTRAQQRLMALDLRVMVSLDALDSSHDRQRALRNGQATSRMARETLERLRAAGVEVCVSITVARQTAKQLIELIDFLLALDVPFSINYARDNTSFQERDLFNPHNFGLIRVMEQVIDHLCQNPPARSLLGALVDRANLAGPHQYTCGVGRNYLVIDHCGQVSLCQQAMANPVTSIYDPHPLLKVINDRGPLQNLPVEKKEGCRTCQWRYWCTGGCAALTTYVNGRANVKSPFCDVYQAIFPKVIELESLRLLKEWS